MVTRYFNLFLNEGTSSSLLIHSNQFENDEQWIFTIFDEGGTQFVPVAAIVTGTKGDKNIIVRTCTVDSSGRVVMPVNGQLCTAPGISKFELVMGDGPHRTATFLVDFEPSPINQYGLLSEADLAAVYDAVEAAIDSQTVTVLRNRVENIIAGTPGDQELVDIRVGADGTTYQSAGTAVRTQVTNLNTAIAGKASASDLSTLSDTVATKADQSDLSDLNQALLNDNFLISAIVSAGFISASDGTISTGGPYRYTDMFTVHPGERYCVRAYASSGALIVAFYETAESTTAILADSISGNDGLETAIFTIPENVTAMRICCHNSYLSTAYLYKTNTITDLTEKIKTSVLNGNLLALCSYSNKFISSSTGAETAAVNYKTSNFIKVRPGERYYLKAFGSSSVLVLAFYQTDSGNAETSVSIVGDDNDFISDIVTIPENINYMRICSAAAYLSDIILDRSTSQTAVQGEIDSINDTLHKEMQGGYIHARRPLIAFILDGDYARNSEVKAIADEHGYKIGFALPDETITTTAQVLQYTGYQNEGNEILGHTSRHMDNTWTDADAKTRIKTCYESLTEKGFNIHGCIGSMGSIPAQFIKYVKAYFDYGATTENHAGSLSGDLAVSGIGFLSDNPYRLWRYSMETSTLAQMKDAVDDAITNGSLVMFYGHARAEADAGNFTNDNFDELLTYIDSKTEALDIAVKTPWNAIRDFYSFRYDDIVS